MMIDLDNYLKEIDLECNYEDDKVMIKAYQLDDKGRGSSTVFGIKHKLKVDKIKSCDYFLENDEKIFIVEISNFFKQLEYLRETYNKIKKYENLDRKDLKLVKSCISPESVIKSEIKNKYLNTLLILSYFDLIKNKNKKVYLVLAFCVNNSDVVRVLDNLKRELKSDLQNLAYDIRLILAKDIRSLIKGERGVV